MARSPLHVNFGAACLWALIGGLSVGVADSAQRETELQFARLSLEHGLSQSFVTSILQDQTGFMWFGTEDGLNRYDGYEFEVYKPDSDDANSLSHGFVWVLEEDSSGNLWVGTQRGLNRWNGNRGFERFFHAPEDATSLSDDRVRAIHEDSEGILWIGTERGLNRYEPTSGDFERFLHDPLNPASLSHNIVTSVYEDSIGELWVGTDGGGLNRRTRTSGFFMHYRFDSSDRASLGGDSVRAILEDDAGNLWVGTNGGLSIFDRNSGTFQRYRHDPNNPNSLADNDVWALFLDVRGVLWVGTDGGLNEFEPETNSFRKTTHDASDVKSLSNNLVRSVYEDRGGVLWVGTRVGGINKRNLMDGAFSHFQHDPADRDSLSHNTVTAFQETRDGSIWIATFGGGLNRFDLAKSEFVHFRHDAENDDSLSSDRVMSLLVDGEGWLWAGTFDAGLNRLNPSTGEIERFSRNPENDGSQSGDGVTALLEDSEGTIWIGTYGDGLNRWAPQSQRFSRYRHDPDDPQSLGADRVTMLQEDSKGFVWVGTEGGGLSRFDRSTQKFTHYLHTADGRTGLPGDVVSALHEDRGGTFWVGTRGGLSALDSDSDGTVFVSRIYTTRDGLPNDFVYGILEDELGNLWLSTNKGLSKFNPSDESFRNYDVGDGLQSNEFNFGAYFRTSTGKMLFGGVNGYNAFFPELVPENRHVPPVVLTKFYKLNEPVGLDTAPWNTRLVALGHNDALVTFTVAALDYTAPEKNTYRYKLENFDNNWIELGEFRRVSFTNLDPGDYTLRVQASNNDGVWNEDGLALKLSVRPPPWRSWWAQALYTIATVGVLLVLWRRYRRARSKEAAYRSRLEREVAERTRELQQGYEELERVNQRLEQSSVTDALTGLRNRRFLFDNIEQETSSILRLHDPRNVSANKTESLAFIMIDLDNYKEINDAHGHDVGDQVLIEVREILQNVCRTSDMLLRWGGDEFLVVGRVSEQRDSQILAGRIRDLLSDHAFTGRAGASFHTTCSIGVACYPFLLEDPEQMSWREVLTIADRALYVSKNSGRDAWVALYGVKRGSSDDLYRELLEAPDGAVRDGRVRVVTSLRNREPVLSAVSIIATPSG